MNATLSVIMLDRVLLPGIRLCLPMQHISHLDLIRDCQRNGITFGCCLQQRTLGEHLPMLPVPVGTEALIRDFGTMPDGTLSFSLIGGRRFRVRRTLLSDQSVFTTAVDWLPPEPGDRLLEDHLLFGYVLQTLSEPEPDLKEPLRAEFDHAASVSWRIIDRLDVGQSKQQDLLEIVNPHERLTALKAWYAETMSEPKAASEHAALEHAALEHAASEHAASEHAGLKHDAAI